MPSELEKAVADLKHLKDNPENTTLGEFRQRWSDETGKQPGEFDAFYAAAQQPGSREAEWLMPIEAQTESFNAHWDAQLSSFTTLGLVDKKLAKPFEPANDSQKTTYDSLRSVFGRDKMVFLAKDGSLLGNLPKDSSWKLRTELSPTWNHLVADADKQVNRNGVRLQSIVETLKQVASDEIYRQTKAENPKDDDIAKAARLQWQSDELFFALDSIQYQLDEWDKLIASRALPDADVLRAKADKLSGAFRDFAVKHAARYENETTPFIKYQILGTMGPLAEKVAAQFAARLGIPTFSAMYALMIDVPRSVTIQVARSKAVEIKQSGKSLPEAWKAETKKLLKLDKNLKKKLPELFADNGTSKKFAAALETWETGYKALGKMSKAEALTALPNLYIGTLDTAFLIRNYKEQTARILQVDAVTKDQIQKTLDGFSSILESGIADGESVNPQT